MEKKYYPTINFLRGIAALMVCIYHFTNYSNLDNYLFDSNSFTNKLGDYGALGVYIFFVITGFVIPLSLFKYNFKLTEFHKFLARRWVRIEIPYLISIVLILVVSFVFCLKNNTPFHLDIKRLTHHIFYTTSFFNQEWYNPIYWTLAIEMQFYILIALIYPLINFQNQKLNVVSPIILALSSIIIEDSRIVFHYGAIFSQGILLLLIFRRKISIQLGVISIFLTSIITLYTNGNQIAIVSILIICSIAFFNLDIKPFNKLGDISYSLYLTHGLTGMNLIYLLERYIDNYYIKLILVLASIGFSMLFAFYYWKIIEYPSKKISKKVTFTNQIE